MIKTVIFDLGGVYFTDGSARAIERISAKYNIAAARVHEILMGELGSRYRFGTITAAQFWTAAKKYWNLHVCTDEIATIWLHAYEPIEGTVALIERLRTARYEILFLSDNVQERIDYLESTYGFLHHFKDGVFSHRVGLRKPDPQIYQLTLEKAAHPAAQCVFIDDKPQMLAPAQELGLHVIACKSPRQLEQDLKELGVLI